VIYRSNAQLFKASFVRMTRTFLSDLPLCQEASNYSSLHRFRHFSITSRRHSVLGQLWDFLSKHKYGKITATVRTMWIPVRTCSSIRQVAHSKFRRPTVSLQGPDTRTIYMENACIKSTVQKTILLALWRQSDYIANILMITNYILLL